MATFDQVEAERILARHGKLMLDLLETHWNPGTDQAERDLKSWLENRNS